MKCPYCNLDQTKVIGGENMKNGDYRRYRCCLICGKPFRTLETYVADDVVKTKKGNRKK